MLAGYRDLTLGDVIAIKEPMIGIARVDHQNRTQDFRDRILDNDAKMPITEEPASKAQKPASNSKDQKPADKKTTARRADRKSDEKKKSETKSETRRDDQRDDKRRHKKEDTNKDDATNENGNNKP